MHGIFKRNCSELQKFLGLTQCLMVFAARSYGDLYPGVGSLGWAAWCGAGITHSWGIPPDFYLLRVCMGPPILHFCVSAPPTRLDNVTSLIPWLSDFHRAQFSDDSGWQLFCSLVVIFAVVVWGGELCLPMPPSWLEPDSFFNIKPALHPWNKISHTVYFFLYVAKIYFLIFCWEVFTSIFTRDICL